jgi:hypothetical protein
MFKKRLFIVPTTVFLLLVAAIVVAMYHYDTPYPSDALRLTVQSTWTFDSISYRVDSAFTEDHIFNLMRKEAGYPLKPLTGPSTRPYLLVTLYLSNRLHETLRIDSVGAHPQIADRGLFLGTVQSSIPNDSREHVAFVHERLLPMSHDSLRFGVFCRLGLDSLLDQGRRLEYTIWSQRELLTY